ncbi:MAG: carboxypeptidase-like regulatory domain-containing protein [Chitinophagaceae bacterium]
MRNFTLKLTLLTTFFTLSISIFAQNIRITGSVTDASSKPLEGITVSVKNTSNATVTSASGSFSISSPTDAVLIFSAIGYQQMEVNVQGKTIITVSLHSKTSA